MLRRGKQSVTAAATSDLAARIDRSNSDSARGPCVDAIYEQLLTAPSPEPG